MEHYGYGEGKKLKLHFETKIMIFFVENFAQKQNLQKKL